MEWLPLLLPLCLFFHDSPGFSDSWPFFFPVRRPPGVQPTPFAFPFFLNWLSLVQCLFFSTWDFSPGTRYFSWFASPNRPSPFFAPSFLRRRCVLRANSRRGLSGGNFDKDGESPHAFDSGLPRSPVPQWSFCAPAHFFAFWFTFLARIRVFFFLSSYFRFYLAR